ncbi:MAG: cytochrome C oxidase subunit IV family protein, partial [Bradymonadaceae bacterium]
MAGYMPRTFVVVSLVLLALAKTFFVAWYYMHLIDERPSIILIACAPFLFSIFLTIGLWPHEAPNSRLKGGPGKDKKVGA